MLQEVAASHEKAMQSLRLFAEKVMPEFRPPVDRAAVAEVAADRVAGAEVPRSR